MKDKPAIEVEDTFLSRDLSEFDITMIGVGAMIGAGIFDGDTVVVEPKQPKLGDVVVALIDGESTLKRFFQNAAGIPFLKSENENYPEMHPVDELVVQGVARSVIRDL